MMTMAESNDPRIELAREGALAVLTINRAQKLNALDDHMVEALRETCREIEHSPEIRVVIVTGAGERAFSAGGDVAAWSEQHPDDFGRFWVREGHDAFAALARLRQPVIAVLNGATLGGGLELAALADLRIAEDHATIGQPESGIGIVPGWSGTQRAVRRFGAQIVRRMALFGEVFSAAEAMELGIVDHVTGRGAGIDKARELAHKLMARGPRATEITKMLINAAEGEERERVLESLAGALAASSDDLQEGLAAFRAKRKPKFEAGNDE
jgi:enoyl-CoA hydratase